MSNQASNTEQQLFELQTQLDQLSVSLQQRQQTDRHLPSMESRLSQLLQHGGEILDRLVCYR